METVMAGDRGLRVVGWGLAAVSVTLIATAPFSLAGGVTSRPGVERGLYASVLLGSLVVVGFTSAGVILIYLRPRNLVGWLLLVSGLMAAVSHAGNAYGASALTDLDESMPLGRLAAWSGAAAGVPGLLLPVLVLPAVYPTGRPASRFWSWHIRASLLGIALLTLATITIAGVSNPTVAGTSSPWDAPVWWAWATLALSALLLISAVGVVVVGTLVRVARASSPERQQMLWLVCVIGAMLATLFLPASEVPFAVTFACMPLAVVVGVLRYHLLGIEVALRRTLLYIPLALLVALIVGGLTTGLAQLVPEGPVPLLVASAVVAMLVIPVAGRLRLLVDRLVLGERTDPLELVDRVGAGLETVTDDPVASTLEVVAAAVRASHASVRDGSGRKVATVGTPSGVALETPLRHGGAVLGVLQVGPRRGEARVSARDERLVHALAPHLAVVIRSRRLTEELARERQRALTATLAERDRLRRDLHDGLGPSLSGIALGLEAAATALRRDPARIPALLERTRDEAELAVREIRRVLDGLRPATLDRHGLEGAVRETAEQLGMFVGGRLAFELRVDAFPVLPPEVEESAFRIVAEAMTNVARHSGASRCCVHIHEVHGFLTLGIVDDGSGFTAQRRSGHGLASMQRRAADVGGRLSVAPVEPHGTAVTAVLPVGSRP
jgi:signal transduction histidine kinase